MNTLGNRIKQERVKLNLSQSGLAEKVGLSYAQIGRYETKGAQPSADILKKIADVLGVTPDYLINGSSDQKASDNLKDVDLIRQFKELEKMDEEDKSVIKRLIDAFITKNKLQQLVL